MLQFGSVCQDERTAVRASSAAHVPHLAGCAADSAATLRLRHCAGRLFLPLQSLIMYLHLLQLIFTTRHL